MRAFTIRRLNQIVGIRLTALPQTIMWRRMAWWLVETELKTIWRLFLNEWTNYPGLVTSVWCSVVKCTRQQTVTV